MTAPLDPSARAGHPPGPVAERLGAFGAFFAWMAEPVYGVAISLRNRRFDQGRNVRRLPIPVVSIGNLSLGGTGKTPVVQWLARSLVAAGKHPAIAIRGYGAARPSGTGGDARAATPLSDEAAEHTRALPGVPVAIGADRFARLSALLERDRAIDCAVLDDGFQHRYLARQCDVVLIDATRDPFADRLVPAGWLREGPESLARAHAVIITHGAAVDPATLDNLRRRLLSIEADMVIAVTEHTWSGVRTSGADGGDSAGSLSSLWGQRVFLAAALGRPEHFVNAAHAAVGPAGSIVGRVLLPDHDPFAPATVQRLIDGVRSSGASRLLVTEKDWSKLRLVPAERWPVPVSRPQLAIRFLPRPGWATEAEMLTRVVGRLWPPGSGSASVTAADRPGVDATG